MSDVLHDTPDKIAAPEPRTASVEQPAAEAPSPRASAATNAQIHARNAAAELAYPRERYGAKTARSWPKPLVAIIADNDAMDLSWNDGTGNCVGVDPDMFFPPRGDQSRMAARAKAMCADCPLLEPCRDHGLKWEHTHGIFGGLTVRERQAIRMGRAS